LRQTFGFMTLKPGAHGAAQNHFAAIGLDRDATGVDRAVALERLLYFSPMSAGLARGLIAFIFDTPFTLRTPRAPTKSSTERSPTAGRSSDRRQFSQVVCGVVRAAAHPRWRTNASF
jgi:hypothetical protein